MPTPIRRLRRRVAGEEFLGPLTAAWLVVLWLLLWGRVSGGLVLSGIVVAVLVVRLFPLNPIPVDTQVRPVRSLLLALRIGFEIVKASIQVAWLAVRPRPTGAAVIAVDLRTHSELVMTAVAGAVGIVPGSVVVEIDRSSQILYVHLVGVEDRDGIERERRRIRGLEARIIRAIGSAEDRVALAAEEAGR